jgi:hypothetical protein
MMQKIATWTAGNREPATAFSLCRLKTAGYARRYLYSAFALMARAVQRKKAARSTSRVTYAH